MKKQTQNSLDVPTTTMSTSKSNNNQKQVNHNNDLERKIKENISVGMVIKNYKELWIRQKLSCWLFVKSLIDQIQTRELYDCTARYKNIIRIVWLVWLYKCGLPHEVKEYQLEPLQTTEILSNKICILNLSSLLLSLLLCCCYKHDLLS